MSNVERTAEKITQIITENPYTMSKSRVSMAEVAEFVNERIEGYKARATSDVCRGRKTRRLSIEKDGVMFSHRSEGAYGFSSDRGVSLHYHIGRIEKRFFMRGLSDEQVAGLIELGVV